MYNVLCTALYPVLCTLPVHVLVYRCFSRLWEVVAGRFAGLVICGRQHTRRPSSVRRRHRLGLWRTRQFLGKHRCHWLLSAKDLGTRLMMTYTIAVCDIHVLYMYIRKRHILTLRFIQKHAIRKQWCESALPVFVSTRSICWTFITSREFSKPIHSRTISGCWSFAWTTVWTTNCGCCTSVTSNC